MARLTLTQRVGLAAGSSVLLVLAVHAYVAGKTTSAEVAAWEREQVAGVAHHVADMIAMNPPADVEGTVARAASDLEPFGIEVGWAAMEQGGDGRWVSVPLPGGSGYVVARAAEDLSGTLRSRLRRSSLLLALGVLGALLVAVEGAVYWGAVRPLRRIQGQLDRMSRGPWRIDAEVGGGKEVSDLGRHIATVGGELERSVTQWVNAERRAALERSRLELRRRIIPAVRRLNLEASNLAAQGELAPEGTRALRRLLAAADQLLVLINEDSAPAVLSSTDRKGDAA